MPPKPPSAADLLHLHGQSLSKGDPISPDLTMASMFHLPGLPGGEHFYGRAGTPTWDVLESALSHLEGAPTLVFPSGMGAISAALFSVLKSGDRILLPSDGYYATRRLAEGPLASLGVATDLRPTTGFAEGRFDGYRLVFIETPSNPGLDLCDIAEIAGQVRAAGGISVVDNTTMTCFGQRPLDLGADILVAADTKAPGGHSDLLMGHLSTRDDALLDAARTWRTLSGGIPGPFEAWLLHRSLETLEVRFDRMCTTAGHLSERLAEHPAVSQIRYPGLPSDPGHALATRQMSRFGFMIGLWLETEEKAEAFINDCPLLRPATSFGGVHSSAERRARWGDDVPAAFVRLSVGCEPLEELWSALEAALG
ncbi:cystathionine gamma-lyase [Pelagovum pacificum]|uniref:Cystathionine gamma-lyase n=1 Tax=Pelagovum pacificum TaxID=2588711 RepID=A0A5C5GC97_9RHOB|nr:cystathionine gamma-lyase [Pelagovum pacificum]QQA42506.1 cystathionine gamma-lyase [Pelagovum pacificum]TNY31590.1 cystathionine gamma-lyase [Pelagovum pacificum]